MNETNDVIQVTMPIADKIQQYLEHIRQWPPELFALGLGFAAGYVCRRYRVFKNKYLYWTSVVFAMVYYGIYAKYVYIGFWNFVKQIIFNLTFGAIMGAFAGLVVQLIHDKAFAPLASKVPFFNILIAEDSRGDTQLLKNPNPPADPAKPKDT